MHHIIDFVQKLLWKQLLFFLLGNFIIDLVIASGSGMCGVLAFVYFFINFAQVTAGVGVFPVISLFAQNKCKMVGISLVQITI